MIDIRLDHQVEARARQRLELTSNGRVLTVLCGTRHDYTRIKSQRGAGILVFVSSLSCIVSVVSRILVVVSSFFLISGDLYTQEREKGGDGRNQA